MSGTARTDFRADDGETYGSVLQTLHWTIVVLVLVQYTTKLILPMVLDKSGMHAANSWHLGVGTTILLLMLLRLIWRVTHPVPPPPRDLPPALQLLSRANHWAFYLLLVVIPIGGWAAANAFGAEVRLAGLVPLPAIAPHDHALGERIGDLHGLLAFVLLGLLVLHVAGALYHGSIKRDGVVGRMVPGA